MNNFKSLLIELRPRQWTKNLFVLAPLAFSKSLFFPESLLKAGLGMFVFCITSSSIYILNDLVDITQDRLHPAKKRRPLAAGVLRIEVAWASVVILLLCGLGVAAILGTSFLWIILGYWVMNLMYSLYLKDLVILDVLIIALGFVLRVLGGAVVISVEISPWLLICTSLLALFLAFTKRRCEVLSLGNGANGHRRVLQYYSVHFLDIMIAAVAGCSILSYALYTISEATVRKFHTAHLVWTFPFVLYGIFRYLYLVYHKDRGVDPAEVLLTDVPLIINMFFWMIASVVILY